MLIPTRAWQKTYPGACAGILQVQEVDNPESHAGLDHYKEQLERSLRARYAGYDRDMLGNLPVLRAYQAYYRQYRKTYHVQLQLESFLFKGRTFPGRAALVEAMFMAELDNLLLTAGHDLNAVRGPIRLDVAQGGERYRGLRGEEHELKEGDMYMADEEGVLSSILYGPDQRTRLSTDTHSVVFAVYAPVGIGEQAVRHHLQDIQGNLLLFDPAACVVSLEVYCAE